jgi:sulfatase maturation enzyme AslB (radical SAM superfamily)
MADAICFDQGLYTHGGHIDSDIMAVSLKERMIFVYISLDECTREDFKSSKGVDRFDKVINGINLLVNTKVHPKARHNAIIGVGFLLHRGNYNKVDDMVALGESLGVDYVQFRPIINYEQAAPNQLVEDVQWINGAINNLRKHAGNPKVVTDTWRFEMYRDWTGHSYTTCNWSAMQTVITPNGKVWRCTNKREHPDALLGDLTQESFADLWKRSGGPCQVNDGCRVMCRGHISNITLDAVLTEPAHPNFI